METKQSQEWNLSPLLKTGSEQEISKDLKEAEEKVMQFVHKWKNRTDYLEKPEILKQALDEYEYLNANYGTSGKSGYYFTLKNVLNESDTEIKATLNKITEKSVKLSNELNFFDINISKIKNQDLFLKSENLKGYKHFLEQIFKLSKHLLSEQEEKIMSLKSQTSHSNWVDMVSELLSKQERELVIDGKKQKKNFSEILSLISDKDKKTRDSAAEKVNEVLERYAEVAEVEINSILLNKKINDELRNFKTPDESRHLSNDIDAETVKSLTNAVTKRFDLSKRFYKLKVQLLNQKKLEYHERSVSLYNGKDKFAYEESLNLVLKVMKNISNDFYNISNNLSKGNIDAFPKKSKRNGAACFYNLKTQPIYVLLNHTEKLTDVMTIAHELGHAINFDLVQKSQNSLNASVPTCLAEVASTFMEDFVLEEILKKSDDEEKLQIIMEKLNDDVSSILRQIAGVNFEKELHEEFRKKGYLSKEEIGKIFQKHMISYMGESVNQSKGSENWWVYWSHIREFFYNYAYAFGLIVSKSLQNSLKQDKIFIKNINALLSTGTSLSTTEILKRANITPNEQFWNKGLDQIESLLIEAEHLAKKLGKI